MIDSKILEVILNCLLSVHCLLHFYSRAQFSANKLSEKKFHQKQFILESITNPGFLLHLHVLTFLKLYLLQEFSTSYILAIFFPYQMKFYCICIHCTLDLKYLGMYLFIVVHSVLEEMIVNIHKIRLFMYNLIQIAQQYAWLNMKKQYKE